jgi:hypothetical protein
VSCIYNTYIGSMIKNINPERMMQNTTNIYGWHTEENGRPWITLDELPAFQVISPPENNRAWVGSESPYRAFSAGTEVMVQMPTHSRDGIIWRKFYFGSCASYALENQECPIAAYERALKLGHPTHWLNTSSVVLTSHKEAQKVLYGLVIGDIVRFEGRDFTLVAVDNENIALKQTEV